MSAEIFIRKLELFAPLDKSDQIFLEDILCDTAVIVAKRPFVEQGTEAGVVHILLAGMACRYKLVATGKRQISAFIIPGDLCDPHLLVLRSADHSVAALSDCTLAVLSRTQAFEMLERPNIAKALLFSSLVEESVLREWVGNIGQRNAAQRMAHLFYEMYLRMKSVGVIEDHTIILPLSQAELGDSLGLSLVHTNKSLRLLREKQLVEFKGGVLILRNIDDLKNFCQFNSAYLHLAGGRILGGSAEL